MPWGTRSVVSTTPATTSLASHSRRYDETTRSPGTRDRTEWAPAAIFRTPVRSSAGARGRIPLSGRVSPESDDVQLAGPADRLVPAARGELAQDRPHVCAHRVDGDVHLSGDLLGREQLGEVHQNLVLLLGE